MGSEGISNVFVEDGLEDLIRQSIPRIQVDKIPAICAGRTGTLVLSMESEEVAKTIAKACQTKDMVSSINGQNQYAMIVGTTIVVEVVAILKKP